MTFISPFDTLGENLRAAETQWDYWEGNFACQSEGCFKNAHEAKYSRKNQLLTWQCPDGHISKIEDYKE